MSKVDYIYEDIPTVIHNKPDVVLLYRIDEGGKAIKISEKEFLVNSTFTSVGKEQKGEYLRKLEELGAMEINEYFIKNGL